MDANPGSQWQIQDGHPLLDETRLVTSKSEVIKKDIFQMQNN